MCMAHKLTSATRRDALYEASISVIAAWFRHWMHSETWWPRLFKSGPEIAWDDYEKDYSDLPAPVMAEHGRLEAAKEATRQLEAAEKSERDRLQARQPLQTAFDNQRKRTISARKNGLSKMPNCLMASRYPSMKCCLLSPPCSKTKH